MKTVLRKAFDESQHPRGQPENAGQFAPSEGASAAVEKAREAAGTKEKKKPSKEEAAADYKEHGTKAKAFKEWFGDWQDSPETASKVVNGETGEPLVVWHGTHGNFDEFKRDTKNAWTDSLGFDTYFFSEGKAVASTYASQFDDGKVMGTYLDIKKPLEIDANGGEWIDAIGEASDHIRTYRTPEEKRWLEISSAIDEKYAYELEYEPENVPEEVTRERNAAHRQFEEHFMENRQLYRKAKRQPFGYDGIIVKNVLDMTAAAVGEEEAEAGYSPYTTVYVTFKPEQIKAVDNEGTFDPDDPKFRKSLPTRCGGTKAFDPSQPREPGGTEAGGQFASEGARQAVGKAKEKVAVVSKQERAESRQDRGDYLGGADQLIGSNATQPAVVKVREAFDTLRLTEGTDAVDLKAAGASLKAAYDAYDADLVESLSKGGATPEELAGLKKLLAKAAEKREALNASVVAAFAEVPRLEAVAKEHADAEPDTNESIPDSELPPEPEEPEVPDEVEVTLNEPEQPERPDPNDYDEGTSDADYKEDWVAYDKAESEYQQALSAWNKENAEVDAKNAANEQAYSKAIEKWEADKEKWEKTCEKLADKWDKTREKEHDVWEKQAEKIDDKLSAATDKAESLWSDYEGELLEIDEKVTDAAQDVLTNAQERLDEEESADDEDDEESGKSLSASGRSLATRYAEALATGHDAAAFALGKAFSVAYPELELCVKNVTDSSGHEHDSGTGQFTSGGRTEHAADDEIATDTRYHGEGHRTKKRPPGKHYDDPRRRMVEGHVAEVLKELGVKATPTYLPKAQTTELHTSLDLPHVGSSITVTGAGGGVEVTVPGVRGNDRTVHVDPSDDDAAIKAKIVKAIGLTESGAAKMRRRGKGFAPLGKATEDGTKPITAEELPGLLAGK